MKRGIRRLFPLLAFAGLWGGCLQAAREASEPDAGVVNQEPMDAGLLDSGPRFPDCFVVSPPSVDLDNAVVYATATQKITLFNNCGFSLPVTIEPLKGTDPLLFATVPGADEVITVPDMGTGSLEIEYTPLVASPTPSQAHFGLKVCGGGSGACERTVQVSARAVISCLQVSPSSLDFGILRPDEEGSRIVALGNICGQTPVHLTADALVLNRDATGGLSPSGAFEPISQWGTNLPFKGTAIVPGQTLQLRVQFLPHEPGTFLGELDIATDDPTNSSVTIPLTGLCGGPVISCTPETLDFGQVAVGNSATLSIVCTNTGSDVPGHPEENLFIPDPNSSAQALTLQEQDPAFTPKLDTPFPALGLAAGQSIAIDVTYLPTIASNDWDRLTISSNGATPSSYSTTDIILTGSGQ